MAVLAVISSLYKNQYAETARPEISEFYEQVFRGGPYGTMLELFKVMAPQRRGYGANGRF